MPRRTSRAWPTDTLGQRFACIAAVAALLYSLPAGLALTVEHVIAFTR